MARVIDLSPSHGIDCAQARSYNHIYLFSANQLGDSLSCRFYIQKNYPILLRKLAFSV